MYSQLKWANGDVFDFLYGAEYLAGLDYLTVQKPLYIDMDGTAGDDNLLGTAVSDTLNGLGGNDSISGIGGDDRLIGGQGDDFLFGGSGNDILIGDNESLPNGADGSDALYGGDGNDVLWAVSESTITGDASVVNYLYGELGDDTLNGSDGVDVLVGGIGSDSYFGGNGDDWLYITADDIPSNISAGGGQDRVFIDAQGASTHSLDVGMIEAEIVYGGGEDNVMNASSALTTVYLIGAGGDDQLTGGNSVDVLLGYDDDDTLMGGHSRDWLYGGNGSDILNGGSGDDFLIGGQGLNAMPDGVQDTFVFDPNFGTDRVYEFDNGIDLIDLTSLPGLTFSDLAISAVDGGVNTEVSVGGGGEIYMMGIAMSDIDATDFVFSGSSAESDNSQNEISAELDAIDTAGDSHASFGSDVFGNDRYDDGGFDFFLIT